MHDKSNNVFKNLTEYPIGNYHGFYIKSRKNVPNLNIYCVRPKKHLGAAWRDVKAFRQWKQSKKTRISRSGRLRCNKNTKKWHLVRQPPKCASPNTKGSWHELVNGPVPTCQELDPNCQTCQKDNKSKCFEYTNDYSRSLITNIFGDLKSNSCYNCYKCPANVERGVVTAHYEANSTTFSNFQSGRDNAGGCSFRTLFKDENDENKVVEHDEIWMQYDVKFHKDFDFVKGGKMPGLYGGTVHSGCNLPDGTNGFSTRYMWGPDGFFYLYLYAVENESKGYSCGQDNGKGNLQLQKDKWMTMKQFIKLNDPGQSNGVAAVYVDGVLAIERTDIMYRTTDTLKIEGILFSTFFGGSALDWRSTKDEKASFRNFRYYSDSDSQFSWSPFTNDQRPVVEIGVCENNEDWMPYISRDSFGTGTGEYEKLSNFRDPSVDNGMYLDKTCDVPTGVRARRTNIFSTNTPVYKKFRTDYGWECRFEEQENGMCDDVEVSFCCPPQEETTEQTTTTIDPDGERVVLSAGTCDTENGQFWSSWLSQDNSVGSGEYERVEHFLTKPEFAGTVTCSSPTGVEVRKFDETDFSDFVYYQSLKADADNSTGYVCKHADHPEGLCPNVEIRFCC